LWSSRRNVSIILVLIGCTSLLGTLGANQTVSASRPAAPLITNRSPRFALADQDISNHNQALSPSTTSNVTARTNTTQTISSSTAVATISSTTLATSLTNSAATGPSISFDSNSDPFGSTVNVSGSNFSTNDVSCSLSGESVDSPTCAITDGTLTGSFVVANAAAGSYTVTATGSPVGDSAYTTFTVIGTPTITLTPQSGSAGTQVRVFGASFSPNDSSCALTDNGAGQDEACSISNGAVTASFTVADVSAASYTITVTGNPEGDSASQTFNVTSSLLLTLNQTSAPVGAPIQVYGTGFPSSDSDCDLSGDVVSVPNCALSSGYLSGSFVVANVTTGTYTITATGDPSGDSTSANFTVTSQLTNVANSTTATPDFSITTSPSITLTQGGSGAATISVLSLNGFSSNVTLTASWVGTAPEGADLTLASPVTPAPGGAATASLTITASTNASTGTFALQVTGTSGSLTHVAGPNIAVQILQSLTMTSTPASHISTSTPTSQVSTTTNSTTLHPSAPTPCAVSSATSGSALAPLAQTLRVFRDQSILKTRTGVAFMMLFNAWYYSFSPPLAMHLGTHQTQRTMFTYALYPLIGALYASYYSYLLVSPLNNEVGAITAGIVAAVSIGLVYGALPISLIRLILRRKARRFSSMQVSHLAEWSAISGVTVAMTYFSGSELALGIATVGLILSTLTLAAIAGTQTLTRLQFSPITTPHRPFTEKYGSHSRCRSTAT